MNRNTNQLHSLPFKWCESKKLTKKPHNLHFYKLWGSYYLLHKLTKSSSGHFSGTTGSKNAYKNQSRNIDRDAIILSKDLDLREHPTKYKQMSSKKLKVLRQKEANRTLTKEEYKHKEWQRRLSARRKVPSPCKS